MLKVESLPDFSEPITGKELTSLETVFRIGFDEMAAQVHNITRSKGFWDKEGVNRNQAEMIALIHSELSEALEALRKNPSAPDKHCPEYTNLEVELADAVVRIMDMAHGLGLDVAGALTSKVRVNSARPAMHGRQF